MNLKVLVSSLVGAGICLAGSVAHAALIGPLPYLSIADRPAAFDPANFDYFHFEDFDDGAIDLPGTTFQGTDLCVAWSGGCWGYGIDSVGNGGVDTVGGSLFALGSSFGGITIRFDADVLGFLPTAVGLVWTDGLNPIVFEAFDQSGASLGTLIGDHADGSFSATTGEDRFYGAIHAGGISRVVINSGTGFIGIEIDHVQFGGSRTVSVPEPATLGLLLLGLAMTGLRSRRRT